MHFYKKNTLESRWPKVIMISLLILVISFGSAIYVVRRTYHDNLKPVSSSGESILVTVPLGATPHEIALLLEEKGVIRKSWAFEWYVRNEGVRDVLKAGTYSLRANMSVEQVVAVLTQGQVATDLVTILPGQRLTLIREGLINAGFEVEAVDKALEPKQYADHPALVDKPADATLEGYLYPETFHKTADTTPEEIIRASLDEMQKRLSPSLRAALTEQGLTVHEGIVLASIVGQEGRTDDERKQIAQVFLKRIEVGMELGADATTRYAINKPTGPLTAEELNSQSPYNTRKHAGLPPGPISNFTESALQAVARPAKGDYLFFVTGLDGVTRFSKTIEEHESLIDEHGVSGE